MRTSLIRGFAALGMAVVAACAPGESLVPPDEVDPKPLVVSPIDMHTVQVRWTAVAGARTYELERRANLKGPFQLILGNIPRSQTTYLDRDLDPATVYGYRLSAYNDLGQLLGVTPVAGGETAPEPGIDVSASSLLGGDPEKSIDSTGYRVTVKGGAINQSLPLEVQGTQRFQPLPPGLYSVAVEDIAPNCVLEGVSPRVVAVTDQGLATIAKVAFSVRCRDRSRGRLTAKIVTSGDTVDANGFKVVLSGLADDTSLPASERAVVLTRDVGPQGGQTEFDNLRPGVYSLVLDNVAALCSVEGTRQRDGLRVTALGSLTEEFKVSCSGDGGTANRPFIFNAAWSPDVGPTGSRTVLGVSLDLRQDAAADVRGFQFAIQTPTAVVRLDSVVSGTQGWNLIVNANTPGQFLAVATRTTAAKGLVPLVNAHYTIVGATGNRAVTRTIGLTLAAPDGSALDDRVRRTEDTLLVGQGNPPPPPPPANNQPPVAVANGPYAGIVGQAVTLTAAGSSDPDGTIVGYAWDFGDGQASTGSSASHSYSAAGSYSATLIVTDDKGAQDTAQAAVTISPSGGNVPTPFTWESTFGTLNTGTQTVPLNISLDLRTDIPETPGQEQLQDWVVDSLKWDPAVLQFFAFNRTSGTGSVNFTQALSRGVLIFRGTAAPAQSTGLVSIAQVVLKVIGQAGQQSPITTYLGAITGPSSTGSFSYRTRVKIQDPSYTVGGGGGPTPTTVAGRVSSPQAGSLAGVRVTLSPGGLNATTGSNGSYTISGVAAGTYSASLTNLPATCTAPAAQSVTVAAAPVTGVDFTVTCQAPQGTTTVSGSVTSSTGGVAGATVTLSPGVLSAVTGGTGAYTIGGVAPGTYSASVTNVPAACQIPASQSVTVASTAVTGLNFSLTCTAPPATGTVTGSITFASGSATPSLTAAVVTITPTGGTALTTNPTAANGYTRTGVPVGSGGGTVVLTNLPTGCTGTTTVNYTGLTGGGTATAPAIQLTCPSAPPANKYPFTLTWGSIAAGKVTMTVKIDMAAFNSPTNNGTGPDRIGAFQGRLDYPARLSAPACSPASGANGLNGVINTNGAGNLVAVLSNTSGASGLVTLFSCTFDVSGAGPTTVSWANGTLLFGDQLGNDIGSLVDIQVAPLP